MDRSGDTHSKLLASLHERAKELDCLYQVEEILNRAEGTAGEVFQSVVETLAPGWQYSAITEAVITYEGDRYQSSPFEPTPWEISADIVVQDQVVGRISVFYREERPDADQGPFLQEEVRLLDTVAARLGHFALYQRLKELRQTWEKAKDARRRDSLGAWRSSIQLLRASDQSLYLRIARKMLNHLYSLGINEAKSLLQEAEAWSEPDDTAAETNVPGRRMRVDKELLLTDKPFEVAAAHLNADKIMGLVQKWLLEDKAAFFINILANPRSSLNEIADAVRRYRHVVADGAGLPDSIVRGLRVTLARRFLTEQLDFIKIAKDYIRISDMETILDRVILMPDSQGKLGGKAAGLLLAQRILDASVDEESPVGEIKVPKTWFVASDGVLDFIAYNDLEDVIEQKFKEIDQVRQEYSNVIQLFKDSIFPPDFIKGLSVALDDFGEVPLIVRSSSLLEDRLGTAFSGKYKSLFLANQGSKQERLDAALDAIAEVYASVFGPDPIEYRREHGLLEFSEEMGILLQEVVGTRVGKYYLPAFAGVAFSNNEFRWSPRIRRQDGIIRFVPGLGTRAVDRVSDDYPTLIVPGQPNLRANTAIDEMIRYSPRKLDVINLEENQFQTLEIETLLRECGSEFPGMERVFSILKDGIMQKPVKVLFDPAEDDAIVTFSGLCEETDFIRNMRNILKVLQDKLGTPVDVEFAHDGVDFYLLQCRPQSFASDEAPAPIPKDVADADVLFEARRFVSNGWMPDITHIVYVDPVTYGELGSRAEMLAVGRAVGKLNKLLPKSQFILMGPGRWGSRGDIKLGVSVTYADISNTAMLVEVARQKGSYLPDLSFGTHFFQDLVESRIRYLPLYPDEQGVRFNERFFRGAPNLLAEILPECKQLSEVLKVIDVPASSRGRILRVLMNADLDEALAHLVSPESPSPARSLETAPGVAPPREQYWRWRLQMAERIAGELDPERFGVVALYVFGSTKNASAGPGSDIDLLVHFRGNKQQRQELRLWLDGWSQALAEFNYLRTGYRSKGLLDLHIVTDRDIANRDSFAVKIGAVTDAARELFIGERAEP